MSGRHFSIVFVISLCGLVAAASADAAPRKSAVQKQENDIEIPSQRDGVVVSLGMGVREGDKVEKGQVLAGLDDRLARGEVAIKKCRIAIAEAELRTTEAIKEETKQRYETRVKLKAAAGITAEEVSEAKLTYERYSIEVTAKQEAVNLAKAELAQAQIYLDMHQIRSPVTGIIKVIYKKPGEGVRSLRDALFLIQVAEK